MLTNGCYINIKDDWDTSDTRNSVKKCCVDNTQDPTCSDCCYDEWQDQLKVVNQTYGQAGEQADQLKKKLLFITDRRDRYRTWVSELDKTEEKARQICHQLEIIATQSNKIWYNSCKAVEAIEILFCMIRDFYYQVDYLKKRYDVLVSCLNVNHDASLIKGQGILKYLDEYVLKLEIIIKTRDDIIKSALQAIQIANLIRNNISTRECPDKSDNYDPCQSTEELCPDCTDELNTFYGFKTIICQWYKEFKCDVACGGTETKSSDPDCAPSTGGDSGDTENCALLPAFDFPICNDAYKKSVETWLKTDEAAVAAISIELKDVNKDKESLQACRNSLIKAIATVDPNERCK